MDSTTCNDKTVVARHETMAIIAVHLSRIQNLVVGDAPPSPIAGVPFGRSGRGSIGGGSFGEVYLGMLAGG
jgi:hypothetical protein